MLEPILIWIFSKVPLKDIPGGSLCRGVESRWGGCRLHYGRSLKVPHSEATRHDFCPEFPSLDAAHKPWLRFLPLVCLIRERSWSSWLWKARCEFVLLVTFFVSRGVQRPSYTLSHRFQWKNKWGYSTGNYWERVMCETDQPGPSWLRMVESKTEPSPTLSARGPSLRILQFCLPPFKFLLGKNIVLSYWYGNVGRQIKHGCKNWPY